MAYEAAVESAVLLKNDGALPIPEKARIALFGRGSYWTVKGGLGSGDTCPRYVVSIADGLKERGLTVDSDIEKLYINTVHRFFEMGISQQVFRQMREWALKNGDVGQIEFMLTQFVEWMMEWTRTITIQEDLFDDELLDRVAQRNDAAIITISRVSTEGFDRLPAEGDYYLREDEFRLITRVADAFHRYGKKVIVVLNVPGPIEIVSWRDFVDAILVIWLPGQETGRAVADLLLGRVSPSGKLPLTWPADLYETPAMRGFPGEPKNNPVQIVYSEDIYVGYRYYDTFNVEPAYEFGYGLSYTRFEYRDLVVERREDGINIRLRVRNAGSYPGKEVVQVYVKASRGGIDKPLQELKGFRKTRLLKPGEEEEVTIFIPIEYLASYNGKYWIVEKGVYEIRVGASSRDIRLTATITIDNDMCFNTSWKRIQC